MKWREVSTDAGGPDSLIVYGDIADDMTPEEYHEALAQAVLHWMQAYEVELVDLERWTLRHPKTVAGLHEAVSRAQSLYLRLIAI